MDKAEAFLRVGGIDLDSVEMIDAMIEETIKPEWVRYKEEEQGLIDQMVAIFHKAGLSDMQIKWGNVNGARFSWSDRKKARKLKKQLDRIEERNVPLMNMMVVLGKNRTRLTGKPITLDWI